MIEIWNKILIYETISLKLLKIYNSYDVYLVNCVSSNDDQSKFIWLNNFGTSFSILKIGNNAQSMNLQTFASDHPKVIISFYSNNFILKTQTKYLMSYTMSPIYQFIYEDTEWITHKFDLSMNLLSCQPFIDAGTPQYTLFTEIPFGDNQSSEYSYNLSGLNLTSAIYTNLASINPL